MAAAPPTEKTALVDGKGEGEPEKTASEKLWTGVSIFFLIAVAVTKTQLTAFLFSSSNFPTAYSFWSCVVTDLLLLPFFLLGVQEFNWPTMDMSRTLGLIIFFTSLDLAFTNIALANISTALQQCIASTNPFWTLLMETVLYRRCQHVIVYMTVSGLVLGAVLTSIGSISKLDFLGVAAACIAVLSSASKYVFTHAAFKQFKNQMGALSLLFWVDLLIAPIYLVWTLIDGELVLLFEDMFSTQAKFWQSTGTAGLGGVRALTQYLVLMAVSATSMSTANMLQQTLNILISIPIQNTEITPYLAVGITLSILFSSFYAYIKANRAVLPWIDETCGCAKKKEAPKAAAATAA